MQVGLMRNDEDISILNDVTDNLEELISSKTIKRGIKYFIHNQQIGIDGVFDSGNFSPSEE
jgi:hypothetical protein